MIKKRGQIKRLIKVSTIVVLLITMVISLDVFAAEHVIEPESLYKEQVELDEMDDIEEKLNNFMGEDFNEIVPNYNPKTILKDVFFNSKDFNLKTILIKICNYFFKELFLNIGIAIKLLVVIILGGILKNLKTSFLGSEISELAFYVCYIIMVSTIFISFTNVFNLARDIIENMVSFMHAMIPLLITLLMSGGNIASSGVMYSILIVLLEVSASLLKNFIMPLVLFSTVISLLTNISKEVQLSKLALFLKQTCTYSLGIILTVFVAALTIQGTLSGVVDGVTSRTAKFAVSTFIPVVGRYLADATDTVLGCALLIKNAAGVSIMIGILSICIAPLIKILAVIFLYRIMCALLDPIADPKFINCLNDIANSLSFTFGVTVSIAFMFLIAITFIIGTSNVSNMIR